MLLHYALTHHTWLILLVASVVGAASPRGPADDRYRAGHSSPSRHARRYVDTFRGGAIIDVPREDEEEEEEEEGGGRDGGGNGAPAILAVAATWNVPRIMPNPGADLRDVNNRHEMAQWVGVTGGRCDGSEAGALLQAGTSVALTEDGETIANAWYEWLPAAAYGLSPENMTVHPGDDIRVTIRVDTAYKGFVQMKNLNTGQAWSGDVAAATLPQSSPPSEGEDREDREDREEEEEEEDPEAAVPVCSGNGTAWFTNEWVLGVPGATVPDRDRVRLPVFENITFSGVEARGRSENPDPDSGTGARDSGNGNDNGNGNGNSNSNSSGGGGGGGDSGSGSGRHFDLGGPTADYWNMTQAGTGRPVSVSEPRGPDRFVVYSPEGVTWVPPPPRTPPRAVMT